MKGYVGQTRSSKLTERLRQLEIGEATQPDEWPPRRTPYFLDNGAFKLWQNGLPFNEERFARICQRVDEEGPAPDWIVVPDRVADPSSLEYSLSWLPRLRGIAPLALVVQDGMTVEAVRQAMGRGFSVIFIGGTLEWKFATAPQWVALAKELGARCHIGRIGTRGRARWAREIGADSVDSCCPLFSEGNLTRWLQGMKEEYQSNMFGPPQPKPNQIKLVRKNKRTPNAERND
jgi:hypothetical protein